MSILSGFKKHKKYVTDDSGNYQLVSNWTNTDTVQVSDGITNGEHTLDETTEWDNAYDNTSSQPQGLTGLISKITSAFNNIKFLKKHSPYVDFSGNYPLMKLPGDQEGWFKFGTDTGQAGIIPNVSGTQGSGHSYLGTSSFWWKHLFVDETHTDKITTRTINGFEIRCGTVVKNVAATPVQRCWAKSELVSLFGGTSHNAFICYVMNGDRAAQQADVISVSYNSSNNSSVNGLYVRFSSTPTAGAYRFNYIMIGI